ncbi:cyclic nucleotide-binding domain-containing protein [Anaerocolumna sedimenticola]|uniref:Cyclic nucleotide-binding domain-containing protein n=1 Tax=Anaerocolumna sedimenticola TaxID=2696063 RepID=A0A6P1TKL5_9FIRM|nr:Crp/Fnr family transcriptional regulator [Anaerocolumna sedimenticola]QHQ60973.1 cyclic nucleotide-binding domain-containing protein [Anaerocolumna sedimenticola]
MPAESNQCMFCSNKLCIHKVPIFNSLNHEDLVKISEKIEHKDYKKGESIFNIGDKLDTIVIINEGSAKAYKYTLDGREQILYIFSEGDFFGEQYLLSNQTAAFTVETLSTLKACTLTKSQLQELLFKHPDIAIKIIEELGSRMSRLENSLQSMGVRSVDARISSLLIDFSEKYGKAVTEGILIRLPLSREGMANYLGVARETVSRKLSQMEEEGIIRSVSNKSILILNVTFLKETADL